MRSTLYELTEQYMMLLEMAEDPDADPETIAGTFEALEGEIEDKADGYARIIRELEAQETALKNEEARLAAKRTSISNNIRNMKNSLQDAMVATGKTKFKTELFSFGIQKNPPAVMIDVDEADIRSIPAEYLIEQAPKVDKTKLKADLKAGKDLTGIAHLVQGESLRIR